MGYTVGMARGPLITAAERDEILALLREGKSTSEVGRKVGRPQQTVSMVARQNGVDTIYAMSERAHRGLVAFNSAQRIEDINLIASRIRDELTADSINNKAAQALRDLSVALGVTIDKRRLEEGLSTSNVAARYRVFDPGDVRSLPTGGEV